MLKEIRTRKYVSALICTWLSIYWQTTKAVYKYDETDGNNIFGRRVTQLHNKLEIVEVHNEMIKSTIKANGKTAA